MMINIDTVLEKTGLCRATIYNRMKAGLFPKPEKVNGKSMWQDADIQSLLKDKKLAILFEKDAMQEIYRAAVNNQIDIGEMIDVLLIEGLISYSRSRQNMPIDWEKFEAGKKRVKTEDCFRLYNDVFESLQQEPVEEK